MNQALPASSSPDSSQPAGLSVVSELIDLVEITRPYNAGVLCARPTDGAMIEWLEMLDPSVLPSVRLILPPDRVTSAIVSVCEQAGLPKGACHDAFVADIVDLTRTFADILKPPYLRIRLDVVTGDACRRFHIDSVVARLVCTYRGQGTQCGTSIDEADPEEVYSIPTGAPILLRGTLWPERPGAGLRHRSPPIAGTGETRLVLVVDPIFDPDEDV